MTDIDKQALNGQPPDVALGKPPGIPEQISIPEALEAWLESHDGGPVKLQE